MIDGEPWILKDKDATTISCCDCELVHVLIIDINKKKNEVTLRHYRDKHLTKKYRKEEGVVLYKRKKKGKEK